jgi:hypothetical protein
LTWCFTKSSCKITHVIPKNVFANKFHGSYKDTISRVSFFRNCSNYHQVLLNYDNPSVVLNQIDSDIPKLNLFFEYSHYFKTIKTIRLRYPDSFIAVRAHNIEPLQHFSNHGLYSKRPFWIAYGMLRLFISDILNKKYASIIFPISEYETRVYWKKIIGKAQVQWLPYYCPNYLLSKNVNKKQVRNIIACMPSSQKNRKSLDLVLRFIKFSNLFKKSRMEYKFVVTGNLKEWGLPNAPEIDFIGMVDDLRLFFPKVLAVAVLSPLGYGFKTTICDAIANGCHVIAHPVIKTRCPNILQNYIIPFDTNFPHNIEVQLVKTKNNTVDNNLNSTIMHMNHDILNHYLFDL